LVFAAELSELRSIDIKNRKAICVAILAGATPNELGLGETRKKVGGGEAENFRLGRKQRGDLNIQDENPSTTNYTENSSSRLQLTAKNKIYGTS